MKRRRSHAGIQINGRPNEKSRNKNWQQVTKHHGRKIVSWKDPYADVVSFCHDSPSTYTNLTRIPNVEEKNTAKETEDGVVLLKIIPVNLYVRAAAIGKTGLTINSSQLRNKTVCKIDLSYYPNLIT